MNPIFKYIGNAKYSTKNLKGGYTGKKKFGTEGIPE